MKQYELKGQTVSISYSEDQEWYYLDRQKTNEVTFINIWDSKEDVEAKCQLTHPPIVNPTKIGLIEGVPS